MKVNLRFSVTLHAVKYALFYACVGTQSCDETVENGPFKGICIQPMIKFCLAKQVGLDALAKIILSVIKWTSARIFSFFE